MRYGCVFEACAEEAADEQFGGCVGVGKLGGGGGAVSDGVVGAGGWDVGFASDLYGAVCGDGGVLGGTAEVGEEEGVGWVGVGWVVGRVVGRVLGAGWHCLL